MKLLIAPESTGYSPKFGKETISTQHDGGAGRYRRDILNSSIMLDCNWTLDYEEYNYMAAFWRSITKKGAIPFEIDLVIDNGALAERTANFVEFNLTGTEGLGYFCSATLEVHPIPEDETADLALVTAYNEAHTP